MLKQFGPVFIHTSKRSDNRMVTESTCLKCGTSKVVSYSDGSLEQWEMTHPAKCSEDRLNSASDRTRDPSEARPRAS